MSFYLDTLTACQARFRKHRDRWLEHQIRAFAQALGRRITVLDVGGYPALWNDRLSSWPVASVCAINRRIQAVSSRFIVADALALPFVDHAFDLVHTNSLIEHIPAAQQTLCFNELCRVGNAVYLQTPNRRFPIEPHFCFPWFTFLPSTCRAWIARHWPGSWYHVIPGMTVNDAVHDALTLHLLTASELQALTTTDPGHRRWTLHRERKAGLTKSFCLFGSPGDRLPSSAH